MSTGSSLLDAIEESQRLLYHLELPYVFPPNLDRQNTVNQLDGLLNAYLDLIIKLEALNKEMNNIAYIKSVREIQDDIASFQIKLESVLANMDTLALSAVKKETNKVSQPLRNATEMHKEKLNTFLKKTQEIVSTLDLPTRMETLNKKINELEQTFDDKDTVSNLKNKTMRKIQDLDRAAFRYQVASLAVAYVSCQMPILFLLFFVLVPKSVNKLQEARKYQGHLEKIKAVENVNIDIERSCNNLKKAVSDLSTNFLGYNITKELAKKPSNPYKSDL